MPEKSPEKPVEEQKPYEQSEKVTPAISLSSGDVDFTSEFQQLALADPEIKKALQKKIKKVQRKIEEKRSQVIIAEYKGLKDEFDITIQNPMAGIKPNCALTYSIGEMIGYSFAEIKKIYPDFDNNLVKRAAVLAAVGGLSFGTKLITHEYGHARAMKESGGESKVVFFPEGRFGGAAFFTKYPDLMSAADTAAWSTAGLNTEEEAAKYGRIKELRTRKGRGRDPLVELPHAVSQLMNKFAISSYILLARGGPTNDLDGYLAASQLNLDKGSILVNSLLMSILSGSSIDNARKTVSYLINPDEKVNKISLKLGRLEVFLPEFSYYLTPAGAFHTTALLANVGDNLVRLEGGTGGVGQSLELQMYDFKLEKNVSLSPYIAVSKRKKGKNEIYRSNTNKKRLGWKVGTEVELKLTDNATLAAEVGYGSHDLITQYVVPTGSKAIMEGMGGNEFYGWMGLTIRK